MLRSNRFATDVDAGVAGDGVKAAGRVRRIRENTELLKGWCGPPSIGSPTSARARIINTPVFRCCRSSCQRVPLTGARPGLIGSRVDAACYGAGGSRRGGRRRALKRSCRARAKPGATGLPAGRCGQTRQRAGPRCYRCRSGVSPGRHGGAGINAADALAHGGHNDFATHSGAAGADVRRRGPPFALASSWMAYGQGRYDCPQQQAGRPAAAGEPDL